jgi:hypothetical protein
MGEQLSERDKQLLQELERIKDELAKSETKVVWTIYYREAPGHMGGDWSDTRHQTFTGTKSEALLEIETINKNWSSVSQCSSVLGDIIDEYRTWKKRKNKDEESEKFRTRLKPKIQLRNGHSFKVGDTIVFQEKLFELTEQLELDPTEEQWFNCKFLNESDEPTHKHTICLSYQS